MARRIRSKKEGDPAKVDESAWEDWRELRDELGKRLGGRDATGLSDSEVLTAARKASRMRKNP